MGCTEHNVSVGAGPGSPLPAVARLAPETAGRLGLADGDPVTVTGTTGSITLPVQLTAMPERVVWVPMRSPGSEVRSVLGSAPGSVVTLSAGSAR